MKKPEHHRKHAFVTRLRGWWRWFSAPPRSVDDIAQRHQAQLLSSLLILVEALVVLALLLQALGSYSDDYPKTLNAIELLWALVVLPGLYVLSRTRYHTLAARTTVILLSAMIFAEVIPVTSPNKLFMLVYLVVPVVLSSALLSLRFTMLLGGAQLAGMLALHLVYPAMRVEDNWIGFVGLVTVLIQVTGRQRARIEHERREELTESTLRYQRLIDAVPVMIAVYRDGRVLYMNRAGLTLLGATDIRQVVGRPVFDFGDPPTDADARPDREGGIPGEATEPRVVTVSRLDGVSIDLEITYLQFNYEGEPAIQVLGRDVTSSRQAAAALARSEARQRDLLAAMPDLMFQLTDDGVFTGYKEAEMGLLLHPDQFMGRSIHEIMPDLAEPALDSIAHARETGQVQSFEYRLPAGDETLDFEARVVAGDSDDAVVIVRDITERKRTQSALERRDAILVALGNISASLFKAREIDDVFPAVLAWLGSAVDMHRVLLSENLYDADGTRQARLRHMWIDEYAGHPDDLDPGMLLPAGLSRWEDELSQGHALSGTLHTLPESERTWLEAQHICSMVIVPIMTGNAWWGTLAFTDKQKEHELSTVEIEALRTVAMTLGAAFMSQQTQAAEREQRTFAETLSDSAAVFNQTLDPDRVLDHILTSIGRVVPHDAANIMLIRDGVAYVARCRGYAEHQADAWMRNLLLPMNTLPERMASVINTGRPFISNDIRSEPEFAGRPENRWMGSSVSAPIRVEERLVGLLNLDSQETDAFSVQDAGRLQAFADQAAIALENARLFDETRRYADELDLLYQSTTSLIRSLVTSEDMFDLGQQITTTIVETFNLPNCSILLVDMSSGTFQYRAQAGWFRVERISPLRLDGKGLVAHAARTGRTVYAPDAPSDPLYIAGHPDTRSELVVPLPTSRGVIGALDLQSPEPDAFSQRDRRALGAFAERLGMAVEIRQLDGEIRRAMDDLERRVAERTIDLSVRNAVAETLSSSLNTDEMLAGVLETTVAQMGLLGGAIYLLSDDGQTLEMKAHYGVTEETLGLVSGIVPGSQVQGNGHAADASALLAQIDQTGVSAVLSVPLWRKGQVTGVITLVHDQPRPWRKEETSMLDAIGRQIATALANADLYAEAVRDEAHIRTILRSVADGLLVFDETDRLALINPAAEALFAFVPREHGDAVDAAARLWDWIRATHGVDGQLPDQIEFELPTEVLHAKKHETVAARCATSPCAQEQHESTHWPCWLVPGGLDADDLHHCELYRRVPRRVIQAHIAHVRDTNDATFGTVIMLHDVTYFRELETLKSQFVSTVSHELRTPLAAVMLQVNTLQRYYDRLSDERRRRSLDQIDRQAQVLRELIEDILELSKLEAGHALPQKEWFDLAEKCRDVIISMEPIFDDQALGVTLDGLDTSCRMRGDPLQLERAFRNLVSNAMKYTPAGGQVTIRLTQEKGEIRLAVEDTGIGIPPDKQMYVFDRFFRTEEAAQAAPGTGLGLSITKEIMDLHDGRMELSSTPGEGSIFVLILPDKSTTRSPKRAGGRSTGHEIVRA